MSARSDRAAKIMCARCEARPGQPCVTVAGGRATWPHSARTGPLAEEWREGYAAGAIDAVDLMRRYVDREANKASIVDPFDRVRDLLGVIEGQYRR